MARVREEAWPDAANADELHDALVWFGFLTETEADAREDWKDWLIELAQSRRAALVTAQEGVFWVPAERLRQLQAVYPVGVVDPPIAAPASADEAWEQDAALIELVRGRLEGQGPTTLAQMTETFGLPPVRISAALSALEVEGFALAGSFTPGGTEREWCERRLLARIHRYTVKRLRAEIEPVSARDYLRFLLDWQGVSTDARREGAKALDAVVEQLAGFEAPAVAWEDSILTARLSGYDPGLLDDACLSGRVAWARLGPAAKPKSNGRRVAPLKSTPISLFPRKAAAVFAPPLALTSRRRSAPERQKLRSSSARTARPSSTRSSMARVSSARRSRRRSPSLSPRGRSSPTASAAFARCSALPAITSGGRTACVCQVPADGRSSNASASNGNASKAKSRARGSRSRSHSSAATASCSCGCWSARRLASEMARSPARLSQARGARRDQGRTLRLGLLGRAVRAARGRGFFARDQAACAGRQSRLGFWRRSAEPRRHSYAGAEARGARGQPRALSRRHSDRFPGRRQRALSRASRAGDREHAHGSLCMVMLSLPRISHACGGLRSSKRRGP